MFAAHATTTHLFGAQSVALVNSKQKNGEASS